MKTLGRRLYALAVLISALVASAQSQTHSKRVTAPTAASLSVRASLVTASPEAVGLSSERLERISDAIQKSVNDGRIAGGVSLVARNGQVAYFKAVGMADREAKKPMRTDSIFRICSMSKPITSVAVMMLYEEIGRAHV